MGQVDKVRLLVNNIYAKYDKFYVKNVKFELKEGDIMGLIGRSGSGKSTILRTIVGLKKAVSGYVMLNINNQVHSFKNNLGYSPQQNALFPYLTVEENLMIFGQLHNVKKSIIKERTRILLERLDLSGSRCKKIVELSGGMKKRADLAATLVHDPKIIILDEPFAGLDISLQKFIWTLLQELSQQGKIIIITSHLLKDIQRYCNEYGLIEQNNYYNSTQIKQAISRHKADLEGFLSKIFRNDISTE